MADAPGERQRCVRQTQVHHASLMNESNLHGRLRASGLSAVVEGGLMACLVELSGYARRDGRGPPQRIWPRSSAFTDDSHCFSWVGS